MRFVPSEFELFGVYFPPILVNGTLGAILMLVTVHFIRRYRLSRFLIFPQYVMAALWAIYTVILNNWVIPA